MNRPTELPLWTYVASLEARVLREWRTEHYPAKDLELALATSVRSIETTLQRKPGGAISVTVSVLAAKVTACEVRYFKLQRAANRLYIELDPVSPSTKGQRRLGEDEPVR